MLRKINQYFHAIKNLKVRQILFRVKFVFFRNLFYEKLFQRKNIDTSRKRFLTFRYKTNKRIKDIKFLNKKLIYHKNFNWNNLNLTDLQIYHLNYFDFLNYKVVNSRQYFLNLIIDWINKNDCLKLKSNDPYPTSLRIVNWIKYISNNCINNEKIDTNLYYQVKNLENNIEYNIDGNHLLANAKALIFGAFYFSNFNLLRLGEDIFFKSIKEQTLADGAHFERSPMYHSIICNDLLDLIDLYKNNKFKKKKVSRIKELNSYFQKYINWYCKITNYDGTPPFFNDTNFSNSINFYYLKSKAEKIFDKKIKIQKNKKSIEYLNYSKFLIYKNNKKKFFFIANVGCVEANFQPGHSNAGIFSFEISIGKLRFIVNGGVSTYSKNSVRLIEKSSSFQNTVTLNNENNLDIWSSFRVGRRTKVKFECYKNSKFGHLFSFKHNGFKKYIHQRDFVFSNNFIRIIDKVHKNKNNLKMVSNINLHPDIIISSKEIRNKNKSIKYKFNGSKIKIIDTYWAPKFYTKCKSKKFEIISGKNENYIDSTFYIK